jgi:hypothetical protein
VEDGIALTPTTTSTPLALLVALLADAHEDAAADRGELDAAHHLDAPPVSLPLLVAAGDAPPVSSTRPARRRGRSRR